jgi:hypothetical protein
MTKYIICKPAGGMIDILSLISMCLKYAIKFNRILIIDTRKSLHFNDNFNKYFLYNNKNILDMNIDIDTVYISIKNQSLYPNGSIIDYINFNPFIHRSTNKTIDFNIDYKVDIILYSDNRINLDRDIIHIFQNFIINPIIVSIFRERFNLLPKNYISIHIRNTDYKSNINEFITEYYNKLKDKPIFLASDDINVIKIFKDKFNIYSFTELKELNNNRALHFIVRDKEEHEKFNIDTVVDFLLLASSKEYYFSCAKSGYSNCAKILFNNKNIINNYLPPILRKNNNKDLKPIFKIVKKI